MGGEQWHRALPSDWVPIVERDSHLQDNAAASTTRANTRGGAGGLAPFSDAYLSTQPAKRRKIAAEEKPEGDLEKLISDQLQDAMGETGAQPTRPVARIVSEVSASGRLREAIEGEVVCAVRRRIERDQDYNVHKSRYPQASAFLSDKKK